MELNFINTKINSEILNTYEINYHTYIKFAEILNSILGKLINTQSLQCHLPLLIRILKLYVVELRSYLARQIVN